MAVIFSDEQRKETTRGTVISWPLIGSSLIHHFLSNCLHQKCCHRAMPGKFLSLKVLSAGTLSFEPHFGSNILIGTSSFTDIYGIATSCQSPIRPLKARLSISHMNDCSMASHMRRSDSCWASVTESCQSQAHDSLLHFFPWFPIVYMHQLRVFRHISRMTR